MSTGQPTQPALDLAWDTEAREHAKERARALAKRDPEAAATLLVQLAAEEAPITSSGAPAGRVTQRGESATAAAGEESAATYNPSRLYAQMAKHCGWTFQQCQQTHFPAFFGILRELNALAQEERDARDTPPADAPGGAGTDADAELAQIMAFAHRPHTFAAAV